VLSPIDQLLIILAASVVVMLVLWVVQRVLDDAGVVDVGWSYLLGFSGIFAAVTGTGGLWPRLAIGAMVGLWGIRLGTHLLIDRVLPGIEDGRYTMLREMAGGKIQPVLFFFFQAQAVSVPILSVPFVLAASSPKDGLGAPEIIGLIVWLGALAGESVADMQLARFKKREGTKGYTCREGLWKYSRHPNYFFEWLMWVAYALVALGAPYGWLGFLSPLVILVLVTKVTGIPPTEARAVQSRRDYKEYQKTTSAFFPWPPKSPPPPDHPSGEPMTEHA